MIPLSEGMFICVNEPLKAILRYPPMVVRAFKSKLVNYVNRYKKLIPYEVQLNNL